MHKQTISLGAVLVLICLLSYSSCSADTEFMGVVYQWTNWNTGGVQNGPPEEQTEFSVDKTVTVTYLDSYHWNNGKGTRAPGTITLVGSDGTEYGPYQMEGKDGMGGVKNAWWYLDVDAGQITLPPGRYTVVDSDPKTWSNNARSENAGFFAIKWKKSGSSVKPVQKGLTITSVSAPSAVNSCGDRGDLNVYWTGDPVYPITLRYQPTTSCPPNYGGCESPQKAFNSYQNPLSFPDALWCCGPKAYFDYEVILINGDGTKSNAYPVPFSCN